MLITGRRCLLLKDAKTVQHMPTDLVGHIYQSVDLGDPPSVRGAVRDWTQSLLHGKDG
jgi:hypothetical protein